MEILAGPHALRAALRAGRRRVHTVYLHRQRNPRPEIREIASLCKKLDVPIQNCSPARLASLATGIPHQGILAQVGPYPLATIDAILQAPRDRGELPLLLALDGVQDPHNLGAIMRTADAVGIHGIILPSDRAASVTPTVSRVSAGAAEYLSVAQCVNLVRTLQQLKDEGLWVVGIEQHPRAQDLWKTAFNMPTLLVLGSEGSGMRRLTLETCDMLTHIPMSGQVSSLNVSVAASLALYVAARGQGRFQGKD